MLFHTCMAFCLLPNTKEYNLMNTQLGELNTIAVYNGSLYYIMKHLRVSIRKYLQLADNFSRRKYNFFNEIEQSTMSSQYITFITVVMLHL